MSARGARQKGVAFEREVAQAFTDAGFDVRGLEAGGDLLCLASFVMAVECKRREKLDIPGWIRQMERDKLKGAISVLAFRQSRMPAYAVLRLDDLLSLVQQDA